MLPRTMDWIFTTEPWVTACWYMRPMRCSARRARIFLVWSVAAVHVWSLRFCSMLKTSTERGMMFHIM